MVELQRKQGALWWGTGVSELGALGTYGCMDAVSCGILGPCETWGAACCFWGSLS